MYNIEITRSAAKEIKKLHQPILGRIMKAIEKLAKDPHPPGCAKLVGSDDLWRIRVGNYRIIYSVKEQIQLVLVTRVAHRSEAYQ